MRALLIAACLLAATDARAVRYSSSKQANARLEKIDMALNALDLNIAAMTQSQKTQRDGGAEAAAVALEPFIAGLKKSRDSVLSEQQFVTRQRDQLVLKENPFTPLPDTEKPPPKEKPPVPPPVPPVTPNDQPGNQQGGVQPNNPPSGESPDIPATPLPGEPGSPITPTGEVVAPAEGSGASEERLAQAAAGSGERSAAAASRAAQLGAGLGQDTRSPESLGGGAGGPENRAGPGAGGPGASPGSAPGAAPGSSPGSAPGSSSGSGLGGALQTMGLSVGRDAAGKPAILHRDGSPASSRELALVRADATGTLPYASHQELLSIQASRGDLRETDFKHIAKPKDEKDLRWSESCAKVSGDCNKHARKGTYKRSEHVDPDDLADIWKAVKEAAKLGGDGERQVDRGASHFARMRAMLAGEGGGIDDAGGETAGRGAGSGAAPRNGRDGKVRPWYALLTRFGASGDAPAGTAAGHDDEPERGRPRASWPIVVIMAAGAAALWKLRPPR